MTGANVEATIVDRAATVRRRRLRWVVFVGLALLLHAMAWQALRAPSANTKAVDPPPSVQTAASTASRPPAAASAVARVAQAPVALPASSQVPAMPIPPVIISIPASAAAAVTPAPSASSPASAMLASIESSASASTVERAPSPATSAVPDNAPPVYPTLPPPSVVLVYTAKRGFLRGHAELHWDVHADGRYEALLQASALFITAPEKFSRGHLDSAGLAPDRFATRRNGRETEAANFQREAGKITYSGPTTEYRLVPGAQDRLSCLLQLSAIVEASPARYTQPGSRVEMFVTGERGGAEVWGFEMLGQDSFDSDLGPVTAWHWRRAPRSAYDQRVDIWLDPSRHHLPVRLQYTDTKPNGDGETWEFWPDEVRFTP